MNATLNQGAATDAHEVPATAVEYVAVSAKPFAGSVEIVAFVVGVIVILLLLRWLVVWERRA